MLFEKPKLDNARKLRGIYFIDLDDMEFKDTLQNARKKVGFTYRINPPENPAAKTIQLFADQIRMHRRGPRICEKAH